MASVECGSTGYANPQMMRKASAAVNSVSSNRCCTSADESFASFHGARWTMNLSQAAMMLQMCSSASENSNAS